jgi:hypothetical protein
MIQHPVQRRLKNALHNVIDTPAHATPVFPRVIFVL